MATDPGASLLPVPRSQAESVTVGRCTKTEGVSTHEGRFSGWWPWETTVSRLSLYTVGPPLRGREGEGSRLNRDLRYLTTSPIRRPLSSRGRRERLFSAVCICSPSNFLSLCRLRVVGKYTDAFRTVGTGSEEVLLVDTDDEKRSSLKRYGKNTEKRARKGNGGNTKE